MDKQSATSVLPTGSDHSNTCQTSLTNWAGNLTYSTNTIHFPETLADVQQIVRQCQKLRVLGSRHSFNAIANSTENLVSLERMNRIVSLDKTNHTITVEAGMRYGDVAPYLHENGYALHNLASLPHITVVGACVTATHGSGAKNGSLASAVSAIEFVAANSELVTLSRNKNGEEFRGAVVNLGALGVIIKLTLDLLPAFAMKQVVYLDLPMTVLQEHFDAIQSQGYSVSLFTDWTNGRIGEVWIKRKTDAAETWQTPTELFGARLATEDVHPIRGQSAENVTVQRGIPGAWYERMPHFRMGFKPSAGAELQSEYFVPVEQAYKAMMAIAALQEKISPHLFISEIRTIAADEFWLSPFYQRPSVAFHFTWKQDEAAVMSLLPLIEAQLTPFGPRPHWGKLFALPPKQLQSQYQKLPDFVQLLRHYDPGGKFRNAFLEKTIFG